MVFTTFLVDLDEMCYPPLRSQPPAPTVDEIKKKRIFFSKFGGFEFFSFFRKNAMFLKKKSIKKFFSKIRNFLRVRPRAMTPMCVLVCLDESYRKHSGPTFGSLMCSFSSYVLEKPVFSL